MGLGVKVPQNAKRKVPPCARLWAHDTHSLDKTLRIVRRDFDAAGHCTAFIERGISSSPGGLFLKPSSGACSGTIFSRAEFAPRFFWRRVAGDTLGSTMVKAGHLFMKQHVALMDEKPRSKTGKKKRGQRA